MLTISVITPSLNQATFIRRCVESVLSQDCSSPEYIVCDGNSVDNTLDILREYGDRLRVMSEPDSGQANAVNKGIRATSGDIIGWLNSDDIYTPKTIMTVLDFFEANPHVDVVYGDALLIDMDDHVTGMYYTEPWRPWRLTQRCFICQPAAFFRRRVVEQFGYLDESLHYTLDYEYWLRLSRGAATFAYSPITFAAWRLHPQAKSVGERRAVHRELNQMLRAKLGRVPEPWLLNHAHTNVELRRSQQLGQQLVPYALEVVLEALRLSLEWNREITPALLRQALAPLFARR